MIRRALEHYIMSKPAVQLSNALRVEVLTSEEDLDALKEDWEELLNESNQCVYFLRWSWNRLWWRNFAPLNSHLYLILCYDGGGQLVGLAPLYWRQRSVAGLSYLREALFLGSGIPITTSEHLDLIARRGCERIVAETIAAFVLEADDVDRLWLSGIPITSVVLPHFRRAIGMHHSIGVCNRSHSVDTRVDWHTFRQGLGKSTRAKIKRCTDRLFKLYDCEFRFVETEEELEPAMNALVQLHQARWNSKGEPGSFALPGVEAFLREAIAASLAEGRLRLWTLTVNGQVAAVLLAFLDNGVAHYFQGGFNPAFARDSLGTVMFALCIQDCIQSSEISTFDFMGGDALYKEHWTKSGRDSVELEWLCPGLRSQLFAFSERGERAGRSFLRMVMPEAIKAARRRRIHSKQDLHAAHGPTGHDIGGSRRNNS